MNVIRRQNGKCKAEQQHSIASGNVDASFALHVAPMDLISLNWSLNRDGCVVLHSSGSSCTVEIVRRTHGSSTCGDWLRGALASDMCYLSFGSIFAEAGGRARHRCHSRIDK